MTIWFLGSVGKASESAVALKHSGNPDRDVDRRMEGVSSYRKIQEFSDSEANPAILLQRTVCAFARTQ